MPLSNDAVRRRILFVTPQLPYPPEQGTAIRNYNLLVQVAQRHDVALLTLAHDLHGPLGPLAELCHPMRTVPAPPARMLGTRLRTLLMTSTPDMVLRLYIPAFAEALQEMLAAQSYDIVQIEGLELAPYAALVRAMRGAAKSPAVVLDEYNAEYLLQRRAFETDLRHAPRWPMAAYSFVQWQRLMRYEREACRKAEAVLAVSEADAQALAHLAPGLRQIVVPNGVDVERYHPGLADSLPLSHPAVVFTGKMDFRPNVDGVLWFYRHVWPLVRRSAPQAHFYVVGKNPDPRLDPLLPDTSVTVTGYVPDALPYFGGADVYVVPLRFGGGTRLKVLEAMAAGLPIVGTTLGVEGIALTSGENALFADSPESFAQAVIALLNDPARCQALGKAARALVLEHYDWRSIAPRLFPLYATL